MTEVEQRRARAWCWRLFGAFIVFNAMHLPLTEFRAVLMLIVCLGMLMLLFDQKVTK